MSLVPEVNNPAIDNLVQSSLESEDKYLRLEWIPYEEITNIKPTQISIVHYAHRYNNKIMLVFLGNNKECTQTLVSEFARIYSLPTTSTTMTLISLDDMQNGLIVATNL